MSLSLISSRKQFKGIHTNFTVQHQRFAFGVGNTATIKLLANFAHVVYVVLVQRPKSSEITVSLVLNPN